MPYWNGYSSSSNSSLTDYDRACAISGYLGTIGIGPGRAVVFGEQPYSTAWWRSNELGSSYLVRWVFAENEDEIIKALGTLSINSWERNDVKIEVASEKLVLFDSDFPGYDIDTSISIQIPTEIISSKRCITHPTQKRPSSSTDLWRTRTMIFVRGSARTGEVPCAQTWISLRPFSV